MEGIAPFEQIGFPLAAFPSETLNLVVSYLDWWSIMDLWCCGDETLHRLMKNRGVTRFEVNIKAPGSDYVFPFGWRFFSDLSVLSLHIFHLNPDRLDSIREGLESVPSTLRKLTLRFADAESALFASNVHLKSGSRGPMVGDAPVSSEPPCRLWLVSSKLPNLDFLEVDSLRVRGRLCNADIEHLPSSLTELRLVTSRNGLDSDVMRYLGPEIVNLWISFKTEEDPVLSVPPQLQSLRIMQRLDGYVTGLVPSNLTYFHAHHWPINLANLPCLPPCTQTISLEISSGEESRMQLPTGLTDLTLSSHGTNVLENPIFLPPGLVTLSCYSGLDLSQSRWPNRLISLLAQDSFINGAIEALPPTLTQLVVRFSSGADLTQPKLDALIEAVPTTIKDLQLIIGDHTGEFLLPTSKFPSLQDLTLYGPFKLSEDLLKGLSKHLESLILYSELLWEDEKYLALLPSSLRDLELSLPTTCTPTCLKYLPRDLERLNVPITGTATANDLHMLPRSVTNLDLSLLDCIEEDAWPELPRTLEKFELGAPIPEIDFSKLPPKLSWFSVPRTTIVLSPEQRDSIPPNIQSLMIGSEWVRN